MADSVEHYVTLFDSTFLPFGLCLHESLRKHAGPFHLWVVCVDQAVFEQLTRIALPDVTLIGLPEVETQGLLQVKPGRTRGEYCWTLTPFTPQFVFDRDPAVSRVTYVDSDLYFFESPVAIFEEFVNSGKHVLITEHAYDPAYDYTQDSGRFCVQFMTFRRTPQAAAVMEYWQAQCLEWCYDRVEPGRFGDQKYLDEWPQRHADSVHVLSMVDKTVAPWNARLFYRRDGSLWPAFFHFHGFRLLGRHHALLFSHFDVGNGAKPFYEQYVAGMRRALGKMREMGVPVPKRPLPPALSGWRTVLKEWRLGRLAFARV